MTGRSAVFGPGKLPVQTELVLAPSYSCPQEEWAAQRGTGRQLPAWCADENPRPPGGASLAPGEHPEEGRVCGVAPSKPIPLLPLPPTGLMMASQ